MEGASEAAVVGSVVVAKGLNPTHMPVGYQALPKAGDELRVTWAERTATSAIVIYATAEVVLVEGEAPRGMALPIGTPVRLSVYRTGALVTGRLAARGRGQRFLVSLGSRPIRRAERVQVDLPVVVHSASLPSPVAARITNLSRSGARLRGVHVPIGSDVDLTFTPPGQSTPVTVRAVVVRVLHGAAAAEIGVTIRLGALWFGAVTEAPVDRKHMAEMLQAAHRARAAEMAQQVAAVPSAPERQRAAGPPSPREEQPFSESEPVGPVVEDEGQVMAAAPGEDLEIARQPVEEPPPDEATEGAWESEPAWGTEPEPTQDPRPEPASQPLAQMEPEREPTLGTAAEAEPFASPETRAAPEPSLEPAVQASTPYEPGATVGEPHPRRMLPRPEPEATHVPAAPEGEPAIRSISAIGGRSIGGVAITVQTRPGALCSISYVTPAGAVSQARGLTSRWADAEGRVSWVWSLSPHTRRGVGQVTVTCDGESRTISVKID